MSICPLAIVVSLFAPAAVPTADRKLLGSNRPGGLTVGGAGFAGIVQFALVNTTDSTKDWGNGGTSTAGPHPSLRRA
jgi:hypothetical protein